MAFSKRLNKTTILFLLIFLLGLISFAIYINSSFSENDSHHTTILSTPDQEETT